MKIRNVFILMAALVSGLYFTGCTEEDGTPTGSAPTGVQVTGMGGNAAAGYTFGVRWTRASGDVGVNKIIATPAAGVATEVTTTTTATQGTITVPIAGKYTITVQSSDGNNSTGVEWATTTRSGVITLHETANNNSGYPSGLILGTPGEAASTARAVSTEGAEQLKVDLVLATRDASFPLPNLALQGADVAGSGIAGGRATRLGDEPFLVTAGLDGDFYTEGIESEFSVNAINSQPIPGTGGPSAPHDPYIILVRTADLSPYYARVEVVPQPNGVLWKDVVVGGNTYRAIDVIVSYQPMANLGYVNRPGGVARGFNTPIVNGPKGRVKN